MTAMSNLKRISPEEANHYIKCNDDFLSKQAEFFTLTPDPIDPQWEQVTYYTSRKIDLYSTRESEYDSWLYVLSNPSMPGIYKIGYSTNSPEIRKSQLSRSTSVPTPFNIEYSFHCYNASRLESEIHKFFESSRTSADREFFQTPLNNIIEAIEFIGRRYLK
jgi:hypothetical protein